MKSSFVHAAIWAAVVHHGLAAPTPDSSVNLNTSPDTGVCSALASDANELLFTPSKILACWNEIPFYEDMAANMTSWLTSLYQFQSTLAYLKSPTPGYHWPAVDIMDGLQKIQDKIASKEFKSQPEFEYALSSLVESAHDSHLVFSSPFQTIFSGYRKDQDLVSYSETGSSVPKVYFFTDLKAKGYTPSDVTHIDNIAVTDFLLKSAVGYQDKDSTYNAALFNAGSAFSLGASGDTFAFPPLTPTFNDTTSYKFSNGSTVTLSNWARLGGHSPTDLVNLVTPQAWYDYLVLPKISDAKFKKRDFKIENANVSPADMSPEDLGFPIPVVNASEGKLTGYFLENNPDTAVLYIHSFNGKSVAEVQEFQSGVTEFLGQAKQQGKSKLILDVRGNGGGIAYLGYDLFKQLFPSQVENLRLRMRAHPAMNAVGTLFSTMGTITEDDYLNSQAANETARSIALTATTGFAAQYHLQTPGGKSYSSWKDFYGPQKQRDDTFSNEFSDDFNNQWRVMAASSGIVVSGYANNTNGFDQIFDPQNVTLLTDGTCSSTCSIVSNLLMYTGNISTLAIGGRPQTDQMAIVGGVQGASTLSGAILQGVASVASALAQSGVPHDASDFEALEKLLYGPKLSQGYIFGVNQLDALQPGSTDTTPLQFASQAAGCRTFYTKNDVTNVQSTWDRIASGNYACVDGGQKPGSQTPASLRAGSGNSSGKSNAGVKPTVSVFGIVIAIALTIFAF